VGGSAATFTAPLAVAVALAIIPPAPADDSLAKYVPADAGLYVEVRQAADLLIPLTEPQMWLALADIVGQPARVEETEEWRRRIAATIGMSPADAIQRLFSQRVAFVGERLGRAQDAAVLCLPSGDVAQLVAGWRPTAVSTDGRVTRYQLAGGVGLGVRDGLLVFGDATAAGRVFPRVLEVIARESAPSLAENPDFRKLLARAPPDPDGILFLRLGEASGEARPAPAATPPTASAAGHTPQTAPETAPATMPQRPAAAFPELPGPLRGAENVLLALHRDRRLLHISAVGDAARTRTPRSAPALADIVTTLPERTLLAWCEALDFPALLQAARQLPPRSALRIAMDLQEKGGAPKRLAEALAGPTCLAVGVVTPAVRTVTAPPIPAVALLVRTRDAEAATNEFRTLFHASASAYNLLALKFGLPAPLPAIEPLQIGAAGGECVELSPLLGPNPAGTALGELHLAWALDDDVLILASHIDWLRQIVRARHGETGQLATVLALAQHKPSQRSETIFVAQTGPIADLGGLWLKYLESSAPHTLDENWWRSYQPGGQPPRLGIDVTNLGEARRLRVDRVTSGAPAEALLRAGDEIVGCSGRRFTTSQPVQEMQRGIAERPNARWLDLWVERDGRVIVKRLPLPFVDPVQLLRRTIAIGKIAQRVVYLDDGPDAAGSRGFLTLETRESGASLYPFTTAPAIQPVSSQPAGEP
jgi:hypothetical protein